MKRTKPLRRKKRLKPVNAKRRRARRTANFGERAQAVRNMRCLCKGKMAHIGLAPGVSFMHEDPCAGVVEPAHVKSRGAGGNRRHLVPLCTKHHAEQHQAGIETFQRTYGLDLRAEAERIALELDGRGYK